MRTMTKTEVRWARAAFGAIFPKGAHARFTTGITDLDVEGFLVDVRSRAPFKAAFGLRVAVWVCALAPVFVLGKLATIASLDQPSREAVMTKLLVSPNYAVRQLVIFLKTIGALLWASAPAVRAALVVTAIGAGAAAAAAGGGASDGRVPVPLQSGPRLVELRVPHKHAGGDAGSQEDDDTTAGGGRHGNVA